MKFLFFLITFTHCTQLSAQTVQLIQMPLAKLKAKVAAGDPLAMVQLALRYSNGVGVEVNDKESTQLYERAAKAGYSTAIGVCAAYGWGCAKNPSLAFSQVEKACKTGDLTAIRNLARFYNEGIGCQIDKAKAYEVQRNIGPETLN